MLSPLACVAAARAAKITDPNGNITYVVFDDDAHEARVYRGWNTSTNMPTSPTQVFRDDRDLGYTESLTMSTTPNLISGRPNGSESIGSIQSLSRSLVNDAGQVIYQDVYFDRTGVSYSRSSVTIGTAGYFPRVALMGSSGRVC